MSETIEELAVTPPNPATTNWVPVGPAYIPAGASVANIGARVYRSSAQSIPNGATTAISFDSVRWDSSGHWSASNPTRLTCKVAGIYIVSVTINWSTAANGANRQVGVRVNGVWTAIGGPAGSAILAGFPPGSTASVVQLNVGDYVEMGVYQDQGGALNTYYDNTQQNGTELSMALVGGAQGPPGPAGASLIGRATYAARPASPAGTTSATFVMMGLGGAAKVTPTATGIVLATICGYASCVAIGSPQVELLYGSGAAPANGAAVTGTVIASPVTCTVDAANYNRPFSLTGLVTGLTLGQAYWFDLALLTNTSGVSVTNPTISLCEV